MYKKPNYLNNMKKSLWAFLSPIAFRFTANKSEYYDNLARLQSPTSSVIPDSRSSLSKSLTSTIIPPSKLDIHQRNQYNRVNHSNPNRSINLTLNNNNLNNNNLSSSNNNNNNNLLSNNNRLITSSIQQQHSATLDSHLIDDLAAPYQQQPTLQLSPTKSYYYRSRSSQNSQSSSSTSTSNQYTNYNNFHPSQQHHNPNKSYLNDLNDPYVDDQTAASDSRKFTERRKKTVRFDGQDSDEFSRWENERQGSQDSTTKDSGIDTSSTFTSSEDSNRGDVPKVF